jgi:hypothetical protein
MADTGNHKLQIRMEDEPKARFVTTAYNQGTTAADLVRQMIAWWMRTPGATLPPRPESIQDLCDPQETLAALNDLVCEHWADQVHGVARGACNACLESALVGLGWTPPGTGTPPPNKLGTATK